MLYTRTQASGREFEPERNLVQTATGLDGGGAIVADRAGQVQVFWHAEGPDSKDETTRRMWAVTSRDDGMSFSLEQPVSPIENGACGCCGVDALKDDRGRVFVLYRGAAELVHRNTHLLSSPDGRSFTSRELDPWRLNACPMSTFALAAHPDGVLAGWETAGQIHVALIDPASQAVRRQTQAPGDVRTRKHPVLAVNSRGETLLAWTESMGWQRGGTLAWQVYDRSGAPLGPSGSAPGVPMWSLLAAFPTQGGKFTIVY
jgi:hypothetical protein